MDFLTLFSPADLVKAQSLCTEELQKRRKQIKTKLNKWLKSVDPSFRRVKIPKELAVEIKNLQFIYEIDDLNKKDSVIIMYGRGGGLYYQESHLGSPVLSSEQLTKLSSADLLLRGYYLKLMAEKPQ